jgi:hypothetical protein
MAFFTSFTCKAEEAFRALLVLQGKATWGNSYVSNDSRERILPNRTFVVTAFQPTRPYRPEGTCILEIQHHFPAVIQPGQINSLGLPDLNAQKKAVDAFFGDTMDTLNLAGTDDQDMQGLATAVTQAGRWLAVPDGTPQGDQVAADNAGMVNFRCDWVQFGNPQITRGRDRDSTNWIEIIHLKAFISHATIDV